MLRVFKFKPLALIKFAIKFSKIGKNIQDKIVYLDNFLLGATVSGCGIINLK